MVARLDSLLIPRPDILIPFSNRYHNYCLNGRASFRCLYNIPGTYGGTVVTGPNDNIPFGYQSNGNTSYGIAWTEPTGFSGFPYTGDYSISFWAKMTSSAYLYPLIQNTSTGGGTPGFFFGGGTTSNWRFGVRNTGASWDIVSNTVVGNDTDWHHLVGTKNSSTNAVELYVDANASGSPATNSAPTTPDTPICIGGYGDSNTLYGVVQLAVAQLVIFHDTVLTSSQVSTIYNSGDGLPIVGSGI